MKTLKIISSLSLALTLIGMNVAIAGNPYPVSNHNQGFSIIYQVRIHLPDNVLANNSYMIQLVDQSGRLVSPAQKYQPGTAAWYNFYEEGPVTGLRIARMVLVPDNNHSAGLQLFSSRPDVKSGTFKNGSFYIFNLYPQTSSPDKQ